MRIPATVLSSMFFMVSAAFAQTTAPTPAPTPTPAPAPAPATGGLADWWWVIVVALVIAAALWYFMRGRNRTRV